MRGKQTLTRQWIRRGAAAAFALCAGASATTIAGVGTTTVVVRLVDSSAPARSTSPAGKFFVVPRPDSNGQTETLFDVAGDVLHDRSRANELLDLNENAPQPDGATLLDPNVLRPGWLLRLPDDASGPGVRVGTLPAALVPSVVSTTTANSPPTNTAAAPDTPQFTSGGLTGGQVLGIGELVAAIGIGYVMARWLVRENALRKTARDNDRLWNPSDEYDHRPPAQGRTDGETAGYDMAEMNESHELMLSGDLISVQLTGAAPATDALGGHPVMWADRPTDMPGHGAFVRLGRGGRGFLLVDLARAPGVVAVDGDPDDAEQLVEFMVRQLTTGATADRLRVHVVGSVAPALTPSTYVQRIASLAELDPGTDTGPPIRLMVWAVSGAVQAQTLESLIGKCPGRAIPVVIGPVRDAPWQIAVTSNAPVGRHAGGAVLASIPAQHADSQETA